MKRLAAFTALISAGAILIGCHSSKPSAAVPPSRVGTASRIDIKHATDPDAKDIDTTPKDITVEDLLATKLPDGFKGDLGDYKDERVGTFERSTFRVSGILKSVQHKKDGDYYLVMQGKSGATAVIEVPDPKFTKGSPIDPKIVAARNEIETKYHPTDEVKEIDQPATIEGVGFYGWKGKAGAGGHGSAPRLMPGTGFKGG